MKHNFVVGIIGGLIGSAMLLIVLSATGIVGARDADVSRSDVSHVNSVAAATLTSTFTYQGQLKNGGNAVNGSCQMAFRLYDDPSGSGLIGSPITTSVPISNGLFTVGLNFGNGAFDGNGRWLDSNVDCGSGFTPLTPRQAVTAAPYSFYAVSTGALQSYPVTTTAPSNGQVLKWNGSAWVPGVDAGGTAYSAGFGLTLIGSQFNVVTSTIQQRVSSSCATSNAIRVINEDGSVTCEPVSGGGFWGLTGNAGTNPATNFLGTTDNMTLTLRVSNTVALRLAPTDETPNLIGGFISNTISGSVNHGSAIGGGGSPLYGANRIQGGDASYSTISGGVGNLITGTNVYNSVIGGGAGNVISGSFAARSTIGGGWSNTASGAYAFIGGGCCNTASNQWTTIGGGPSNTASGNTATIGGGYNNTASSPYATISGGTGNTASGTGAFVGGGGNDGTTEAGNQALGNASTIGGGISNTIPITGNYAFIGGGISNTASGAYATIPGGYQNKATMTDTFAAGNQAQALYQGDFVWADSTNASFASTGNDQFLIRANGGVGINTSTPIAALDVNGKVHASGGFNGQCLSVGYFNGTASGSCNMDVAEAFGSAEQTEPGDLVTLVTQDTSTPTVHKSTQSYAALLVGVVSQNPGLIFDNGQTNLAGDNSKLITADKTVVALVGRVQVKVSMENGFIAIGDPLTSSSTPGAAMKATRAGKIVGYAMGSAKANGTVLALVQPGYYLPTNQLAAQADSTPSFNWFNLLSLIAFAGFAFMWLQLRRLKEGARS